MTQREFDRERKMRMVPVPEVAPLLWRKSSRSAGNGCCVEVAFQGEAVAVRDSKNPDGPALFFGAQPWREFLVSIRQGEFDSP
jgi:hypothetical protein